MDVAAHISGYVSLLESNDRGKGLAQAADFITPSLELGPQLRVSRRILVGRVEVQSIGTLIGPSITVPPSELWHVTNLETSLSAGDDFDDKVVGWSIVIWPSCELDLPGMNENIIVSGDPLTVDVSGFGSGTRITQARSVDLWLTPGTIIAPSGITFGSGSDVNSSIRVLAEKFRV